MQPQSKQFNFIESMNAKENNGRFYTEDALSVWTNLGKCFVVRLGYASLV